MDSDDKKTGPEDDPSREGPGRYHKPPAKRDQALPWSVPKPTEEDPAADERVRKILESPSYIRPDLDEDFLARDDMRASRLQIEYLKPEILMQEEGVRSTIVVFGGTRIAEPMAARRRLAEAQRKLEESPSDAGCRLAVQAAERVLEKSRYYEVSREFSRIISRISHATGDDNYVIITGGGPGIMEAANRGAHDVGAKSIGLNVTLPHEQFPNPYITPELCFQFRYFALRKMHFMKRARALVAFPGGYGTFDELFETLTLIQTRKIEPLPVVLVGEEFWRRAFDADFLAEEGVIDPEDKEIFVFAETAEEIADYIIKWYRTHPFPDWMKEN